MAKDIYIVIDNTTNEVLKFTEWKTCWSYVKGKNVSYKGFKLTETDEMEEFIKLNNERLNEHNFNPEKNEGLHCYVDGSRILKDSKCIAYSYGLCAVLNDKIILEDFKSFEDEEGCQHFQIMGELKGALAAARFALKEKYKEIYIIYDYVGVEKFATGEWKSEKTLIQQYTKEMMEYRKKISIHFVKVKSHVKEKKAIHKYNDTADALAAKALLKYNAKAPRKTPKRCSFTGHRPSSLVFGYDESSELCKNLKKDLKNTIEFLYESENVIEFNTGMALGFDMWAAEAVIELKKTHPEIKLYAYVPTKGPNPKWPSQSKERYWGILGCCEDIYGFINNETCTKAQLMERNRDLVNNADFVVALYNGKNGGTGYTVNYAITKEKEIINIFKKEYGE